MQTIRCVCPHCRTALNLPPTRMASVRCPLCGTTFPYPAPPVAVVAVPIPSAAPPQPAPRASSLPLLVGAAVVCVAIVGVLGLVIVLAVLLPRPASTAVAGPAPQPETAPAADAAPPVPKEMDPTTSLTPQQKQKIAEAIERGVGYLGAALEGKTGDAYAQHPGGIPLAALTLLHCGVPENDPILRQALAQVRENGPNLTATYDLSASVMCLDRLGDPKDKELIRSMALRLIGGQQLGGGWTYGCNVLNAQQEKKLLELLIAREAPGRVVAGEPAGDDATGVEQLPVITGDPGKPAEHHAGDNSNTQFATLAVWGSRKHGVPVRQALALVDARFRNTQSAEGAWTYNLGGGWQDSMTCAGLIGLAAGKGLISNEEAKKDAGKDVVIEKAVAYLATNIGKMPAEPGANQKLHMNAHGDLYYLWSLERVAVLFDAREIGGKEWYGWGADHLVATQKQSGAWRDQFAGIPDTCFALLFLRRANVAQDLTGRLRDMGLMRSFAKPPGR